MNKLCLIFLCLMILTSVSNANESIRDVSLKRSNYDGKTISEICYSSFEDVNMKDANLHNANIYQLNMSRGIIAGANFDGAHISNSTFNNLWPSYWGAVVKMPNMYVENTTFSNIDFSAVDFSGCHFTYVIFENCNFSNTSLQNSAFKEVKFNDCSFIRVNAQNCIFTEVAFIRCSLGEGDFSGSKYEGVVIKLQSNIGGCMDPPKGIPSYLFYKGQYEIRDEAAISFN